MTNISVSYLESDAKICNNQRMGVDVSLRQKRTFLLSLPSRISPNVFEINKDKINKNKYSL